MRKQRFYFDTSVFGGVFDSEFKDASRLLFDRVWSGQVVCVYSDVTEGELIAAPERIRVFFAGLPREYMERHVIGEDEAILAARYVSEKVVDDTSLGDCLHIAVATISHVDVLVSWNFKHIVNIYRVRGYNSINLRMGYPALEIRSPREVMAL